MASDTTYSPSWPNSDENDRREQALSSQLIACAEEVFCQFERLPEGDEASVGELVGSLCAQRGTPDSYEGLYLDMGELFDLHSLVMQRAHRHRLKLDSSAYENMVIGLPFNIPLTVHHLDRD